MRFSLPSTPPKLSAVSFVKTFVPSPSNEKSVKYHALEIQEAERYEKKTNRKEWIDFYSAVSFAIDNDDHFVLLMKCAWNLD